MDCALCGRPLEDHPLWWNVESHTVVNGSKALLLTPMEARIFDALWQATSRGGMLALLELTAIAYSDEPDGGPLGADKCVSVHLVHLRRKLERIGVAIMNVRGAGYVLGWDSGGRVIRARAS
jgi:DNA-binding response OmpR family regulator